MITSLNFKGPFSIFFDKPHNIFDADVSKLPGVYLWTVETKNGYLIDYVGETGKRIMDRFVDHVKDQFTGRYNIYDPDTLRRGIREPIWHGYHWRKKEYDTKTANFFRNAQTNIGNIVRLFSEYQIFVANVDLSPRLRKRVESAIIKALLKDDIYSKGLQKPPQNTVVLNADEQPVIFSVNIEYNVVGLPAELKA